MILTIDFETYSALDLKKVGMYRYAEDATTGVFCLAVKVDDKGPLLWLSPYALGILGSQPLYGLQLIDDDELEDLIIEADEIHAWNAGFERCLWTQVMAKRLGFDQIPVTKWRCTMANAGAFALPRSLDRACNALGLPGKDKVGYDIMMRMCKPHPILAEQKAMLRTNGYTQARDYIHTYIRKEDGKLWSRWLHSPEDLLANCKYCLNDAEIEYQVGERLPFPLTPTEQAVWTLDQLVNDAGVTVDLESIGHILTKVEAYKVILGRELPKITRGEISTANQTAKIVRYLNNRNVTIPDLKADTVRTVLLEEGDEMHPVAKRVLEIRQEVSKSSLAKIPKMRHMANKDRRVRGLFRYNGADTGRWSGSGVQLQNLPRGTDVEAPRHFREQSIEWLQGKYPNLMDGASQCIRPCLLAEEGRTLVANDFASIEGRVLAWLAEEEGILDAYKADLDMYKLAYMQAFGTPYDDVTKAQRTIGKPIELGLGFGGWTPALRSMGRNYGVTFPSDEQCEEIIRGWRDARQLTVRYWYSLYDGAMKTTKEGCVTRVGRIQWFRDREYLYMMLPSGRCLAYHTPQVISVEHYGKMKPTLHHKGSMGNGWHTLKTWHGRIIENAVQAIARDLLAEAMLRLNQAGFRIIMHVHDEAVCEEPKDNPRYEEMQKIVLEMPAWADGLPMGVDGWVGDRYRKE